MHPSRIPRHAQTKQAPCAWPATERIRDTSGHVGEYTRTLFSYVFFFLSLLVLRTGRGGVVCRLGFQLACFPVYTGVMQLRVNKEVRIPVRVIVGDNILGSITDHLENKLQLTAV